MFNLVKGTHDVILDEAQKYTYIENVLQNTAQLFGYKEFRTPIIETSELFLRSVGDSSDIVRKEMYTFEDKGGRSITLRPEITAGIVRSMVNAKLFAMQDYPVKGYYTGPCFRYERPQQGRYRQFNQFGIECIGITSPHRDAEVISMGFDSLVFLGFENVTLKINTLGDDESRENYKKALRDYFGSHIENMCNDCKERYQLNVLRILDCKDPDDQEIVKNAPKISEFLSENAKQSFEIIKKDLDFLNIPYEVDESLVRGLDYYSGVVFEFHYTSSKGKNYGAIGAGGHYGKLVSEIGGPEVEGCGYAMGIERLASVMSDDNLFEDLTDTTDIYVMPLGERATAASLGIANYLRVSGYNCEVCLEGKGMSQMFKKAERRNALYAIIVGDNELDNDEFVIKNLASQEQFKVSSDDLLKKFDELLNFEGRKHFECCDGDCDCEGDCDCDESEENKGCCCRHKE